MVDNDELPNCGSFCGTLHLDSIRKERMQTQAGVAETLRLPPEKRHLTSLPPTTDRPDAQQDKATAGRGKATFSAAIPRVTPSVETPAVSSEAANAVEQLDTVLDHAQRAKQARRA